MVNNDKPLTIQMSALLHEKSGKFRKISINISEIFFKHGNMPCVPIVEVTNPQMKQKCIPVRCVPYVLCSGRLVGRVGVFLKTLPFRNVRLRTENIYLLFFSFHEPIEGRQPLPMDNKNASL